MDTPILAYTYEGSKCIGIRPVTFKPDNYSMKYGEDFMLMSHKCQVTFL